MAKGYFDIDTAETMPGAGNALARSDRDARQIAQDRAEAERLKAAILEQIQGGQEPQLILYTAIKAIGLLSNDPDFTETAQGRLDAIYKDLAQLSLFQDNAAKAQERLDTLQTDYNAKLRRSITRQLQAYHKVETALNEVLKAVDEAEPPQEILT